MATTVLLALALTLPLAPCAPVPGPPQAERESLQVLLDRLRGHQRALFESLRGEVERGLAAMEAAGDDRGAQRAQAEALVALGIEVAPLLVPHLDPGEEPTPPRVARSQEIAWALERLPSPAVTDELVAIARGAGRLEARRNALRVLGSSPERERVIPAVREVYRTSAGPLKGHALQTLARLGGEASLDLLAQALDDEDEAIVALALEALLEAENPNAAPAVLALLRRPADAAPHAAQVVAYLAACPDAGTAEHLEALLGLVSQSRVSIDVRARILETLPRWQRLFDSDLEERLEDVTSSPSRDLREAALVALTRMGDRNARRELLERYDDAIEDNPDWPQAFRERGKIRYRVEDYRGAVSDYKDALKLAQRGPRTGTVDDVYVELARTHVRMGRLKDAQGWLEKAPVSKAELLELAQDPDFHELRDHARYGELLRP